MSKSKSNIETTSTKILVEDIQRLKKLKEFETEPNWFTIKKIIDQLKIPKELSAKEIKDTNNKTGKEIDESLKKIIEPKKS